MNLNENDSFNLEGILMDALQESKKESAPSSQESPSASPAEEAPQSETVNTPQESNAPDADAPPAPKKPEDLLQELSLNDPDVREFLRQQGQPPAQMPYPQTAYAPPVYTQPVQPPLVPQAVPPIQPPQSVNEEVSLTFDDLVDNPNVIVDLIRQEATKMVAPVLQQQQQQQAFVQQQLMQAELQQNAQAIEQHVAKVNPALGELLKNAEDPRVDVLATVGAKVFEAEMQKHYGHLPQHIQNKPTIVQNVTELMLQNPQVKVLVESFLGNQSPRMTTPTQGHGGTPPQQPQKAQSSPYLERYLLSGDAEDMAKHISYLATQ